MMIKLVNPDCDAATTVAIRGNKTIDSISFVGLSEPMSVDAAITAIKNNALAEIKTSGEKGENALWGTPKSKKTAWKSACIFRI